MLSSLPTSVSTLEPLAASVLTWIVQALLLGSVLAACTWLVAATVMRRARPALQAGLWLIVLLKFVMPIGPAWSWSLASLVSGATGIELAAARAALPTQPMPGASDYSWVVVYGEGASSARAAEPPVATVAKRDMSVPLVLAVMYAAGLLVAALARLTSYVRFVRSVRRLPLASDALRARVESICRSVGVRHVPLIRVSEAATAPYILNAFRPTLVLATRHLDQPGELEAVVLHEIAHLRRGDLLVRYLQWFAGTLLYFWPVVAWVNRRIDLAREHACDEWALRHGKLSPVQYARCLLRCVRRTRSGWSGYAPVSMAANATHVERRIEVILNTHHARPRSRFLAAVGGATATAWLGFALSGASAAARIDGPAAKVQTATEQTAAGATDERAPQMLEMIRMFHSQAGAQVHRKVVRAFHGAEAADGADASARPALIRMMHGMLLEGAAQDGPSIVTIGGQGASLPMDTDGDGQVSMEEHHAYVIAKAMSDPEAVLAQFPEADGNADGALDADEAAALVTEPFQAPLPPPDFIRMRAMHGGDQTAEADAVAPQWVVPADADSDVLVEAPADGDFVMFGGVQGDQTAAFVTRGDLAPGTIQFEIRLEGLHGVKFATTDVEHVELSLVQVGEDQCVELQSVEPPQETSNGLELLSGIPILGELFAAEPPAEAVAADGVGAQFLVTPSIVFAEGMDGKLPPEMWILHHIENQPTREEIGQHLSRAEGASLKQFLKQHPEADVDGDGKLTRAEREKFSEEQAREHRVRGARMRTTRITTEGGVIERQEAAAGSGAEREPR